MPDDEVRPLELSSESYIRVFLRTDLAHNEDGPRAQLFSQLGEVPVFR